MPRYTITEACVACDICRPFCPAGAILPGEHLYGCGRMTCQGCPAAESCEMQVTAIRGAYVIDQKRCDSCGACVTSCVVGAIAEDDEASDAA